MADFQSKTSFADFYMNSPNLKILVKQLKVEKRTMAQRHPAQLQAGCKFRIGSMSPLAGFLLAAELYKGEKS
jgi:hypothetical protein